jgi:hypothetical protein
MDKYNIGIIAEQGLEYIFDALSPLTDNTNVSRLTCITQPQTAEWNYEWWSSKYIQETIRKQKFDYIIMHTHNGNPHVQKFQRNVTPKYGYIDIEHDLFCDYVENAWVHMEPNSRHIVKGIMLFTKMHNKYALSKNISSTIIYKPKWVKHTLPAKSIDTLDTSTWSANNSAVIFYSVRSQLNWNFPYTDIFDTIWVKTFHEYKDHNDKLAMPGTTVIPKQYSLGGKSVPTMPKFGKFWFVYHSSAYVESILYNCIPLMYPGPDKYDGTQISLIEVSKITEVLSLCRASGVRLESTMQGFDFPAIYYDKPGDETFKHKIKLLQNDPKLFADTIKYLKNYFFDADYDQRPSIAETVLDIITS